MGPFEPSDPHYIKALHAVNCSRPMPDDGLFDKMFEHYRRASNWNYTEYQWQQIHDALLANMGSLSNVIAQVWAAQYTDFELDALIEFHTRQDLTEMRKKQNTVAKACWDAGNEFGAMISRDLPAQAEAIAKRKGWLN